MKVAVRYDSRTGNTRKLAEAVASALDVEALSVDQPLTEGVEVLFLASAVYAAGVSDKIKNFIASLDPSKVGKVVNISTAALLESTYAQVSKLVRAQGLTMAEEEFHCRGAFLFAHKGKPDAQDLANAQAFAKQMVGV